MNILRYAPGGGDVAHPGAGIVPSAHVEPHIFPSRRFYRLGYLTVSLALVEGEALVVLMGAAAAEVYLYIVEPQILEEKACVIAVVAIETHTGGDGVAVIIVAAGVAPGVAVYSGFEAETMYMIYHRS